MQNQPNMNKQTPTERKQSQMKANKANLAKRNKTKQN